MLSGLIYIFNIDAFIVCKSFIIEKSKININKTVANCLTEYGNANVENRVGWMSRWIITAVDDTSHSCMCIYAQVHSWRLFGDSVYLLTRLYAFARRWKDKIKETAHHHHHLVEQLNRLKSFA